MATEWIEPMNWENEGVEPSENLQKSGFEVGYKPPASVMNYFLNRQKKCITQLQEKMDTHGHDDATETASGFMSVDHYKYIKDLIGSLTKGLGNGSLVMSACTALGTNAFSGGAISHASGDYTFSFGRECSADGDYSSSKGYSTIAKGAAQNVIGKYNVSYAGATSETDATGSMFIIGVGTSDESRANAFRVTNAGKCMGTSSFMAAGADYAEYYEWLDGNPDNEDRRGYFVTLDGNKIRKATAEDDYILGVISATPSVVGNAHTDMWQGMYLTDIFGERLTKTVEVPESIDEETGKVIPAHKETRFIINPEYDYTKEYKGRNERKEWAAVGTHGQLIVVDDGTCEVNHYCKVAENGSATKAEGKTEYRVIERISPTHIKIVIK